jgi:hypothetical protein
MEGTAKCSCCFRLERRRGAEVLEVLMAGGARQPEVPAPLALWRALRRVAAGELAAPVAVCEACGQPMALVEGELAPLERWEIRLGDEVIAVGPDGKPLEVDEAEAERRIEDHFRPQLVDPNAGPVALGLSLVLLTVAMGMAGIIGACECPSLAMTMAAGGAAAAGRSRPAR